MRRSLSGLGLVLASIALVDLAAAQDAGLAPQGDAGVAQAKPPPPSFVGTPSIPVPPGIANARSRAALVTQIQSQTSTFQATPTNHPIRPALAFQLGDDYAALANVALREEIHAQTLRQQFATAGQNAAAAQQKILEDQAHAVMGAGRKKAIECYSLVVNDHPTFVQIDRVLVRLAEAYEAVNDGTNARRVYYDLIKKRPNSPYVPRAYLAFGEHFSEEAQTDSSKWDLAEKAYTEVTKYPLPANEVLVYAWYRLAFVHWNKGEVKKARSAFQKAIDAAAAHPQIPGAATLATAARVDAAGLPP